MTKAYARGKGYGDAYGLNYVGRKLSDNYVEKSGDPQLKAAIEAGVGKACREWERTISQFMIVLNS
ncbi:MAG: hypothetical protein PHG19_02405 [Anaerotignum sp.]|nr:hypothetical protein [Anaerotignum sp.]